LSALWLILFSLAAFTQEVISDLQCNPHLYHKYKSLNNNEGKRMSGSSSYIFSPDTLSLPFVDDFSVYHLKSYEPAENFPVAFRVNRSVALTDTVLEFSFMTDTSWRYVLDMVSQTIDSFPNSMIQLLLNNDLLKNTDTVRQWPPYDIYDTSGNAVDTTFLTPDSILEYSIFNAVKDPNALWLENYVYVNDKYPVNKLSYGVATFDGLDEFGLPFNDNSINIYGPADTLTSQPINLLGLDADNVYLSFVYEPMGLGNKPEGVDSLILEFKIIGSWTQVWAMPGSDTVITDTVFQHVLIPLDDPFYFDEAFQFRFRNKATISGNNDLWHLDYVYLNRNRSAIDTVIQDITVLNPATSFLKNYISMPWDHFEGYESSEALSNITLTFRNNYSSTKLLDVILYSAKEVYTDTLIYETPPLLARNIEAFSTPDPPVRFSVDFIPFAPLVTDSVLIDVKSSFLESNPSTRLTTENDTVSSPILFKNYFAYDDGTAEKAYGLEPQGLRKFAYEFRLNHPDTIRAIQFYFAQVNQNLSLFEFTLMVWSSIDSNNTGAGDDTLYAQPGTPFYYLPERNGFVTYRLDSPLVIDSTVNPDLKFYVGWQQLFAENIQLGLDLNTQAKEHMYFYSSGTWKKSAISGFEQYAAMIRPIVGKNVPIIGTGVGEMPFALGEILLYPNPAEDFIYLKVSQPAQRVDIYDMQGRLLKSILNSAEHIDISDFRNGLYFLRVSTKDKTWIQKFVKQ